ncbi:hypothetical protein E3N88_25346 [Mikania micrantha]|uniref:TF-B3 domain-containing protein n=1 Tax=Mikania micrantha TaxID=192012 RepID=A0A5N6N7A8_9ASTR|nr:hypothetical protein E3N88_25346 [Mikania micrantha]
MEAEGLSKHLKRCGRYYVQGWLKFVKDNKLSEGDKCLFCYFKQEEDREQGKFHPPRGHGHGRFIQRKGNTSHNNFGNNNNDHNSTKNFTKDYGKVKAITSKEMKFIVKEEKPKFKDEES